MFVTLHERGRRFSGPLYHVLRKHAPLFCWYQLNKKKSISVFWSGVLFVYQKFRSKNFVRITITLNKEMEQASRLQESLVNETQPMGGVASSGTSHSQVSDNTFSVFLGPTSSSSTPELQIAIKDQQFSSNPNVESTHSSGLLAGISVQQSSSPSHFNSATTQVNASLGMPMQVLDSLRQDQLSVADASSLQDSTLKENTLQQASVNLISAESIDTQNSCETVPVASVEPPAGADMESSSELQRRQGDTGFNVQQINSLEMPTATTTGQQYSLDSGEQTKAVADTLSSGTSNRSLRTKRSFTTEFKLECVEHAERTKNKTKTAKIFNVNRRRVQEWCTQKERLMSVPKQQKRLSGGGRRQIPLTPSPQLLLAEQEGGATDEKEKGLCNIEELGTAGPQSFTVPAPITTVDPAFVDFIVQNLPSMDFSTLPSSMVKVFQDWSKISTHPGRNPSVDEGMSQDSKVIEQTSVPPPPEQCDTEDEIDVGDAMESGPSGNPIGFRCADAENQEARTFDSQSQVPSYSTTKQQDSEEPLGVSQQDVEESSNEQLHEAISGQTSIISNGAEEAKEASSYVAGVSQIDPKISIDLNSLSAWIHENALECNVPAILDALMQAQAASTKATSGQLAETPMEETLDPDDTDNTDQKREDAKASVSVQSPSSPRARVKNRYSLEFKLNCIAHAESTSKCAAAREFNVDRRRVQDWCSKKDQLRKMVQVSSQTVVKLSRERIDSDVEQELVAWVKFQQEAGVVLNRKMLGDEATKLYHEKGETDFVSSVGWVAKFMVRNNICLVGRSLRIKPPPESEAVATSS